LKTSRLWFVMVSFLLILPFISAQNYTSSLDYVLFDFTLINISIESNFATTVDPNFTPKLTIEPVIDLTHAKSIRLKTRSSSKRDYTPSSEIPWWDADYSYRERISLTLNSGYIDLNSTYFLVLDTTDMVSGGLSKADCNDLRVIWYNNITKKNIELDRDLKNCDIIETVLYFRAQENELSRNDNTN